MKKIKRILAAVGACLLILLYVLTLIFALIKSPNWFQWFKASLFCTVALPVVIYAMIMVYRILKKD